MQLPAMPPSGARAVIGPGQILPIDQRHNRTIRRTGLSRKIAS